MISHNKPTIGSQEMSAVENVLKSGQLSQSSEVKKFEEEFPVNSKVEATIKNITDFLPKRFRKI